MNIRIMLVVLAGILVFIGSCKDDSEEQTTQTENMLEDIRVSVSDSADICQVCKNAKCTCNTIEVPITHPGEYRELVANKREPKEISIVSAAIKTAPVIDGNANDDIWQRIEAVETLDHSSQRPIEIKSCHDDQNIYFLVKFIDLSKSTTHKSWIWDKTQKIYIEGNDREDCLVLKWKTSGGNMSYNPELAEPHTADVWFWKARRTNPAGYFDDKYQAISEVNSDDAFAFPSEKYGTLYLTRKGDSGKSAYEEKMFFEYIGDAVHKYYPRQPEGSRADIQAQGKWDNNFWTIEFVRKLDTGHTDDIVISADKKCVLGICLYEMAATGIEDSWTQPLFRTGDVFDILSLTLE